MGAPSALTRATATSSRSGSSSGSDCPSACHGKSHSTPPPAAWDPRPTAGDDTFAIHNTAPGAPFARPPVSSA